MQGAAPARTAELLSGLFLFGDRERLELWHRRGVLDRSHFNVIIGSGSSGPWRRDNGMHNAAFHVLGSLAPLLLPSHLALAPHGCIGQLERRGEVSRW